MKEEKDKTELYQKLQSTLYKYGAYKKENLGEGMILVEELNGGYWKPRYLIDNEAETACEFMDSDYCLLTVTADKIIVAYRLEIDFKLDHKTLDKLKQEDLTVAQYTLDKMRSAIAYYLGEYRDKVNRINDEKIKREKLEKISEYEERKSRLL